MIFFQTPQSSEITHRKLRKFPHAGCESARLTPRISAVAESGLAATPLILRFYSLLLFHFSQNGLEELPCGSSTAEVAGADIAAGKHGANGVLDAVGGRPFA